jgi:hemerythrin-like metal-binding protein
MALPLQSSAKLSAFVAIENVATRKLIVSTIRECGYSIVEETKDLSHTILHLERGNASNINIILMDKLGGSGHLQVLKYVRWESKLIPRSLPIIGLDGQWTADELIAARDAGISSSLTLPLTRHSLQLAITAALKKQQSYIDSPTFHGPDRRSAIMKGYKGPYRRADDETLSRRQDGSPVLARGSDQRQVKNKGEKPQGDATSIASVDVKAEIEWTTAIATGQADIDDQHKKIIDFLKILGSTSSAEYENKAIDDVLKGLSDYVKQHFKHEECLMDSFDYDDKDKHKRIHAAFVQKLDGVNREDIHKKGGGEKLFFIIYNWLVTHIVSIDRIMIAKMNGEYDEIGDKTIHKQTGIVIENAYELATKIMNVNLQASAISDKSRNKSLIQEVNKSTERLINLMELANSRVQISGCSNFQLRRLGEIRSALKQSADTLAETAAKKVVRTCNDILIGKKGIPLGIGDVLRRQMSRVSCLVAVIGGSEALSLTAKSAANEAHEKAAKIFELGLGSAASLKDFKFDEK